MESRRGSEVLPQETVPRSKPIAILNRSEDSERNDVGPLLNRSPADRPNSTSAALGPDTSPSPSGSVVYHASPKLTQSSSSSSAPGLTFYMSPEEEMPLPADRANQSRSSSSSATVTAKNSGQEDIPRPDARARVIVATGGYDRNIRLWDFKTGINYRSMTNRGSHVNKLAITGDKRFIVAAGNPDIHFYEMNTMGNEPVTSYCGHKSNVTCLDFHRGGNWMVSSSEDKTVRFWDLRVPSTCHQFICPDPVNSVKLHPNDVEIFCAGEQGVIRVLDLRRNICSFELQAGRINVSSPTAIKSLDINWNGTLLVAANAKGMCFVWSLSSGDDMNTQCKLFTRIQAHGTYITKCCFSPELSAINLLATCSADKTLKLWKVGSADVCSADKTLKLWKVGSADVTLERILKGHERWVWDCAFSRDGANLISSSSDSTTRLWEVSTGNILQTYHVMELNAYAMNCCAFEE